MAKNSKFSSTTMAERAENPRPNSVSAILAKVDIPNDYVSEPQIQGEQESGFFSVTTSFEEQVMSNAMNREDFLGGQFNDYQRHYGSSAWRKTDPAPIDQSIPHKLSFPELKSKKQLADYYGWFADFFLISDRLKLLIEELDPGSLDCTKAVDVEEVLDDPYWVCLPRRNLEAVDTEKSDVRVVHNNYPDEDGNPYYTQRIDINYGAVFDPAVIHGADHFWELDLHDWVWSRELVAKALSAGITGVRYKYAGRPTGADVASEELAEIDAEFAK